MKFNLNENDFVTLICTDVYIDKLINKIPSNKNLN